MTPTSDLDATAASDQSTASPSIPAPLKIAGILGLVLAVVGAVLFTLPARGSGQSGEAESKAALSTVSDFAVAYNTYDVADVKGYQARVSSLLTKEYDKEFVQLTDALFTAIKSKKQKSGDAVVRDVAVETIDEDSAVVLAVVDAKVTNTDSDGQILRQFRWTVNLQKVGGDWKVAKYESVAAQPAEGTSPAPNSTTGPSADATPTPGGDDQ